MKEAAKIVMPAIDFQTDPSRYRHWRVERDGAVAYLIMDVDPAGGLGDYELKLNSYDLGVDIELNDAVQRLRFEHPEIGAVVIKSGKDNVFCAGANIRYLGKATHGDKVNFCKFTNETRLAIEDASENSKQVYICAINGNAAGGGIAIDGADIDLLGILRSVLDGEARLVGELAEVHLVAMRRFAEIADIGAGAEHIVLARLDDDGANFGMLESQPLHRVVQFDIDTEVVGVELELVVAEAAGRIDVHDQIGDRAVALDAPVTVARRLGLEIDCRHNSLPASSCTIFHSATTKCSALQLDVCCSNLRPLLSRHYNAGTFAP